MPFAHPILSCADAAIWEQKLLGKSESKAWDAMLRAGSGVARDILRDYLELAPLPETLEVLVLCGSGHNGGDALIATQRIIEAKPGSQAEVILVYGREQLRPLAKKALEELIKAVPSVKVRDWSPAAGAALAARRFHLCIDGVLGMQFKPPVREPGDEVFEWVDALGDQVDFRAAIDLPSGVGDLSAPDGFSADFTYATGIVKAPILDPQNASRVGRVRYIDIGFFEERPQQFTSEEVILEKRVMRPLRRLRDPQMDKRHFGHLFLLGGSRSMPGAIAMSTLAAIRAGSGLTTCMVPQHLSGRLAPLAPEAMWLSLATHSEGTLNHEEALKIVRRAIDRATAIVIGPGLEPDKDGRYLVSRLVRETKAPIVLDAGALQPEVITAIASRQSDAGPVVVTPHQGEFKRLAPEAGESHYDRAALVQFCQRHRVITVLKGPITRISNGDRTLCSLHGGPVLARGGSGDFLAGMIGALLSQGGDAFEATCRAVTWHGLAAEALARTRGQHAVRATELLDYLSPALRS